MAFGPSAAYLNAMAGGFAPKAVVDAPTTMELDAENRQVPVITPDAQTPVRVVTPQGVANMTGAPANTPPPVMAEGPPQGLVNFGAAIPGGTAPAHEAEVKGPIVKGIEDRNIDLQEQLGGQIKDRTVALHEMEAAHAQEEVNLARTREQAKAQAMAADDAEARQTQQRFATAVDEASTKGAIDPDRLYNSKSTGEKIAQNAFVLLGGIFGGLAGQENKALQVTEKLQEQDIAAQKFAYAAGLDKAAGRKTAFGMLVDRLGSTEAAEHGLRAAMLDRQIADARVQKAKASTVEEINAYTKYIAGKEEQRATEHKNGYQFVPRQQGGARYAVTNSRGQTIYVDEKKRNELFEKGLATEEKYGVTDAEGETKVALAQIENKAGGGKAAAQEEIRAHHRQEGAEKLAARLKGLPEALQSADMALKATNTTPRSYTERMARATAPGAAAWVIPEDAKLREGAFSNFSNQAMKLEMGSVTKNEELRAAVQFANSPSASDAERVAAINRAKAMIKAEMDNAYGGASPEIQDQFRTNRAYAKPDGAQPGAGVSSFKPAEPKK